eukprot:scaffold64273_cov38-Cyclotella_meneghiniana.AAC.1
MKAFMWIRHNDHLSPPSAHSQPHLPGFACSNLLFLPTHKLRRPNHTPGMKALYEERERERASVAFVSLSRKHKWNVQKQKVEISVGHNGEKDY